MSLKALVLGSTVDELLARTLYGVHLVSLPVWLGASLWALCRLRRLRGQGSCLPTQAEIYSVRLLAVYVVTDSLRAMDQCYDSTDGACRAVWGVVPYSFRLFVWAVRDMALLCAIGFNLNFYLGWTHAALGRDPPRRVQAAQRFGLSFAVCGIAGSFLALTATNRQSWQVAAVFVVVALNIIWARVNLLLLREVLPDLEKRCGGMRGQVPAWVEAAVSEVRLAARLVLTADVAILVLFPAVAIEKLVLRNAHWRPLVPGLPLDSWIGNTTAPLLVERPSGVSLNPTLEVVELLIGWLQFIYVLRVGGSPLAAMGFPGAARADSRAGARGYVSEEILGKEVQRAVSVSLAGKKAM